MVGKKGSKTAFKPDVKAATFRTHSSLVPSASVAFSPLRSEHQLVTSSSISLSQCWKSQRRSQKEPWGPSLPDR